MALSVRRAVPAVCLALLLVSAMADPTAQGANLRGTNSSAPQDFQTLAAAGGCLVRSVCNGACCPCAATNPFTGGCVLRQHCSGSCCSCAVHKPWSFAAEESAGNATVFSSPEESEAQLAQLAELAELAELEVPEDEEESQLAELSELSELAELEVPEDEEDPQLAELDEAAEPEQPEDEAAEAAGEVQALTARGCLVRSVCNGSCCPCAVVNPFTGGCTIRSHCSGRCCSCSVRKPWR